MQFTRKVIYSPFSYLNESRQTFFEDPSIIIYEILISSNLTQQIVFQCFSRQITNISYFKLEVKRT